MKVRDLIKALKSYSLNTKVAVSQKEVGSLSHYAILDITRDPGTASTVLLHIMDVAEDKK